MAEVRINVAELISQLQKMIRSEELINSPGCCIFRVPNILHRHNPKAYEPNAFSIGPFHHGKPHLQRSQIIKASYLKSLLSHAHSETVALRDLVNAVSRIQDDARDCYAGPIGMSRDDFVKLLVLDGCFIVELFRRKAYEGLRETPQDPIFGSLCQVQFLYHDLILLENQIPWMVLKLLFDMTGFESRNLCSKPLAELAIEFFKDQSCFSPGTKANLPSNQVAKHILDLLRSSMVLPSDTTKSGHLGYWENNMPSASSLKEAGIKFRTCRDPKSILAVSFNPNTGVLEIPPMVIHEHTEPLFRNLIGYEQCLPDCDGVVTSYAVLLDNLINTDEDMKTLCKNKVIRNWLNPDDATKFFNKLYDDTFVTNFHYAQLIKGVNKYCRRRWPKYRTVLMHDYFKHPWSLLSVIAAASLLTLAFLQTYFTITKY